MFADYFIHYIAYIAECADVFDFRVFAQVDLKHALQSDNQVDNIQTVQTKVVKQQLVILDFVFIQLKIFDENLFDLASDLVIGHYNCYLIIISSRTHYI